MTTDASPLDLLIIQVGTELDKLGSNGRQLSRRMIIELAIQHGYSLGYKDGREDRAIQFKQKEQGAVTPSSTNLERK